MSLLAVVTFSPAHLSRLMLPRQNFWKLSPSPPQPPPSALSGAAVSWPLLRRFGHRIQRACLGQKPCLSGYVLCTGKWNAMALVGPASRFEEPRRGRGRISEARGGLLRAPPTPKRLGESSLDLSMNSTVLVFTFNFIIPFHLIAVFHNSNCSKFKAF